MSDKELIAAARQHTESYREALDKIVTEYDMALYTKEETLDRLSRSAVPNAASDKPDPCEMTHTPPFDFAQCEAHDTTFPLGGACKWHGKESIYEVLQYEVDEQRGLKVRAELERDAALAAIERVRGAKHEVDSVHQIHGADCLCGYSSARSRSRTEHITEAMLAALDGAPEPDGQWEYRARTDYGRVVAQGSLDEIGSLSGHIWERRRKAGPWVPVEGEKP